MNAPITLRAEIRQLLASSEPLTRPEIFKKLKLATDEATLSTVLSQLCVDGSIRKAGERHSVDGGRELALYTRAVHDGSGGGHVERKKKPGPKPAKRKARGPYKKRAKAARAAKKRIARLPKVQRRNADSSAPKTPGFRCAVFSDGSMNLERAGEIFEMNEPEVRVLFAYLEKVMPEAHA